MELITILLSGLLTFVSPAGLIIDSAAENVIRSQFNRVEQLEVRVDNAPSYQVVQGQLERVQVAGRGLWLTPEFRIAELELETDPIDIDLQRLGKAKNWRNLKFLHKPLQAGVRLVLTQQDINQALQSPAVIERLRQLGSRILGDSADQLVKRYEFVNPQVEFLDNNRLRVQLGLQELGNSAQLIVSVETGLGFVAGHQPQLIEPVVLVNGIAVPPQLVTALTSGISNKLDLRTLEEDGILARILQLNINKDQLEVAAFVRAEKPASASPPDKP